MADLRTAEYVGELAEEPVAGECDGRTILTFYLDDGVELEARVVGIAGIPWKDAHRVELVRVLKLGVVKL